ncbi:MAG TPA: alpha/beta hydrolase domain-containing protein [Polyangiales bacterium]|nr:alpha/beta hydrolase domain-containing protein [Polyangiales bacterium]
MHTIASVEGPRAGRALGVGKQLEAAGYVEQEFVIAGRADLYTYDAHWNTVQSRGDIPYRTRVLVRRPEDPARASGDAVLEALHPAGDMASAWPRTGRTILRERMIWIGVTQDVSGLRVLKNQDPERYADLDLPEFGLGFDIVAQVATWLRGSGSPVQPLSHMFMTGASFTGTFQRVFIGDGFHARARRPDGGPAIEGYLIQISSGAFLLGGYTPLGRGVPQLPADDRRRTIQPLDVPVIELLSEGEAETNAGARRPDSDALEDRYRLYEVPGACHMTSRESMSAIPVLEEPSDFPMDMLCGGALLNLRRWVVDQVPAPRAERLVFSADPSGRRGLRDQARPLERDEHGNAIGGVRSPWVDVPIASYYPHSTTTAPRPSNPPSSTPSRPVLEPADIADLMGCMTPFSPDKLRALYGTPESYRRRFDEALQRMFEDRWIAEADRDRARARAAKVEF